MVQMWVSKQYGIHSPVALLGSAGEVHFAVESVDCVKDCQWVSGY